MTARDEAGNVTETTAERTDVAGCLTAVRGFYLDITQWAAEDPARWAQWAAPSSSESSALHGIGGTALDAADTFRDHAIEGRSGSSRLLNGAGNEGYSRGRAYI